MKFSCFLLVALIFISCTDKKDISSSNSGQISIAFVGDSTSVGFGANGGANTWNNGLSYGFMNQPELSPNFTPGHELSLVDSSPYISQEQQDNINIPSAVRLLRTEVERKNPDSIVYNYSSSGATAGQHVVLDTMYTVAGLIPKPEIVFINLGINSAKNEQSQRDDLWKLIEIAISFDMIPVLVKPNNIAVAFSPEGNWSASASPDDWYPMDNWQGMRDEIDIVSEKYDTEVIDLGSDDGLINETLLYDPFHPNENGYRVIFNIYLNWLNNN